MKLVVLFMLGLMLAFGALYFSTANLDWLKLVLPSAVFAWGSWNLIFFMIFAFTGIGITYWGVVKDE